MSESRTESPAASTFVDLLREYERGASSLLESFNETDTPREGIEGSIALPVCGEWRYFDAASDKDDDHLFALSIVFHHLDDAFALIEDLRSSPTFEGSMKLATIAITIASIATEVGITLDKTWLDGESIAGWRSKGGFGTKKFTKPEEIEWLKEELKNHHGKKAVFKKISESVFNKHGYKSNERTVRNRIKELGLLENAKRFPK